MRRFVSFVLIVCVVIGFAACAKPDAVLPTEPTAAEKPFAGKTLHIYGIGSSSGMGFVDGDYFRMMSAAIEDWARLSGAMVVYLGSSSNYNTPGPETDIIIRLGSILSVVQNNDVSAWTEAEYNILAQLTGDKRYLDMQNYQGKSYGVVFPWTVHNSVVYFNKSMFAQYNVKSPLDYWNEGNWTWETFETCMKEMTRDLDGDGTKDIYGLNTQSLYSLFNSISIDEKGEILSTIDDPWVRDYFQLRYNAYTVDGTVIRQPNRIADNVKFPMWAMQISHCTVFDYESMFRVLSNGDEIMAVPLPRWTGENGQSKDWLWFDGYHAHLAATCDQREAAVDLLSHMIKCGMDYISDMTFGAVGCNYDGAMQGVSEYSFTWKNKFAESLVKRKTAAGKLPHYDLAHMAKVINSFAQIDEWYFNTNLTEAATLVYYEEINQMPPESAVAAIREKYQSALAAYNNQ